MRLKDRMTCKIKWKKYSKLRDIILKDGIHSSIKFLNSRHKGVCVCVSRSIMSDSMTPWNVACQAPLSMEFSRQGYRRGLPFPSPGGLPNPETEPGSPALQAYALPSELKFLNSRHEGKSYKFPKRKIKLFLKWKDETCVRLLICTHTQHTACSQSVEFIT